MQDHIKREMLQSLIRETRGNEKLPKRKEMSLRLKNNRQRKGKKKE